MKITYKVQSRKDGETLGPPLVHTKAGDLVKVDGEEIPADEDCNSFASSEAAKVWLIESLRLKQIPGQYADYAVQGYDDNGDMVEEISPEDRQAAGNDARLLIQENPDLQMAFNTMIAARQLYGFAFIEMERAMTVATIGAEDEKRSPHPLTIEVLTQAVANAAGKSFEADNLFGRLGSNIMPWMNHAIRKNILLDENDKKVDADKTENQRRTVRIPVGVKIDPEDDGMMPREKPLVLIGYGPAVTYLLDLITTNVLAARDPEHPDKLFTVIRFDDSTNPKPDQDYLLRLARPVWTNCARSKEKLGEFVARNIASKLNKMPDLLVVDDLAAAFTVGALIAPGGVDGGFAPYRLNDANKRLSDWYKHIGMGMVAGVPTSGVDKPVDCSGPELESLRTFCTVRPVTMIRATDSKMGKILGLEPGNVRLLVGKNAWSVDVDEKILQPKVKQVITG